MLGASSRARERAAGGDPCINCDLTVTSNLGSSVTVFLGKPIYWLPDADDRARSAVDADFAIWEAEMTDGPATAQARPSDPPGRR